MSPTKFNVGGQAVLEGVMMRSPGALAVAVRKQNGEVAVKEAPWRSLSAKYKFLTWPFLRGVVVLIESLYNGIEALAYSANQAMEEETDEKMGTFTLTMTIIVSLGFAVLLFVVAPHYLSLLFGRWGPVDYNVKSLAFHAVDGVLKLAVFIAYIWLISLIKDIKRVFQYHGAEHMSIYAYEAGRELTVENAREFSTLHPRCGTAFLIVVLLISILFFSLVFPFIAPRGPDQGWAVHLFYVGLKLLMMLPIAGAAYEMNRWASRHMDRWLPKLAVLPGMWVQKFTTREPSDDQIEIALIALKKTLAIETAQSPS
ncbi:MAG: DUF1385 domain-containing protein [Pseudomonadota bacterium]